MTVIDRRKLLVSGIGGVASVAAFGSAPADSLAARIRHLRAEEHRWAYEVPDELSDAAYEQIIPPAEKALVGVSARTSEDALTALDYVREKELSSVRYGGEYGQMIDSLINSIRGYIASQ
jgi:hypothetical protein